MGYAASGPEEVGEGKHRGVADRSWAKHKEVGRGPGTEPSEAGAGGGPASTGASKLLQASFNRSVTLSASEQGRISTRWQA